jgi:hypothetical protein
MLLWKQHSAQSKIAHRKKTLFKQLYNRRHLCHAGWPSFRRLTWPKKARKFDRVVFPIASQFSLGPRMICYFLLPPLATAVCSCQFMSCLFTSTTLLYSTSWPHALHSSAQLSNCCRKMHLCLGFVVAYFPIIYFVLEILYNCHVFAFLGKSSADFRGDIQRQ